MASAKEKVRARQDRILEFMRDEVRRQGYAPTVREIGAALGIKSTSTVHKDIEALVARGLLRKDPAKPRALVVVDNEPAAEKEFSNVSLEREEIISVPLVGNVAAGTPITAIENIEDEIPVPARYVDGNNYILKVRGESMINVGIMDGDMILVRQCSDAENGDIVVAMVDGFEGEATVKRFYREKGHIRLQPENDTMSPIIVNNVKILGKVRGVFRYYK